jgi:outer membrane receptor protein involved in Fe transport
VIKSLLAALLGLAAWSLPAAAQDYTFLLTQTDLEQSGAFETRRALTLARPDLFTGVDSAVLLHGIPTVTLLDGRRFPLNTELGRMGMVDLPVAFLSAVEVQKPVSSLRYGSDAPGGVLNLRTERFYSGGEVGFFYGRSDGKYGREDYSAHIIGGIGNDKFNITVGAAYHESSGRSERRR